MSEVINLTGVASTAAIELTAFSEPTQVLLTGSVAATGPQGPAGPQGPPGPSGSGGGGSSAWGGITGDITTQSDLQTTLATKLIATSNLSDVSSAASARSNLGLAIGTNVEGFVTPGNSLQYYRGDKTFQDFNTAVRANRLNDMGTPSTSVNMSSQRLINTGDPVSSQDVATKNYVDAASQGLSVKATVVAATTAALPTNSYSSGVLTATANGALTVDGVTVSVADRVLVKNEATAANNGIYVVTATGDVSNPYVLTRASDMDASSEVKGAFTLVIGGSVNASTGWVVNSPGPFTLGTTAIPWSQFSSTSVPDATSSVKGKLQLTGDIGGTAASPTVNFGNDALHVLKGGDSMSGELDITSSTGIGLSVSTAVNSSSAPLLTVNVTGTGSTFNRNVMQINNSSTNLTSDSLRITGTGGARLLYLEQEGEASALIINAMNRTYNINDTTQTTMSIDAANTSFSMVKFVNHGISTTNNTNVLIQNTQSTTTAAGLNFQNSGQGNALRFEVHASTTNPAISIDSAKYGQKIQVGQASGGYGLYVRTDGTVTTGLGGVAKFENTTAAETNNVVNIANSGTGAGLSVSQLGDGSSLSLTSTSANQPSILNVSKLGIKTTVNAVGGYGVLVATDGIATTSPSIGLLNVQNTTAADTSPVATIDNRSAGKGLLIKNNTTTHLYVDASGNINLGGDVARSITQLRATSGAGNSLTVQAGGAQTGANSAAGGSLILSSGIATGSNVGRILIQTSAAGATGTTDQALATTLTVTGGSTAPVLLIGASITGTVNGLNLNGELAMNMFHQRRTTSNLAGRDLTITSGGATSAATDKASGNLILTTGISTGTGAGSVIIQTSTPAGSTGTTDNSNVTRMTISNAGIDVASNKITSVTDPGSAQDAATKNYVDTHSFANPMTTLGDLLYESGVPAAIRLAGNTTSTKQFLTQTGTGSVSAAPTWGTIQAADVPVLNQNTTGSAAKWTTARSLGGNSVDGSADVAFANKFIVQGTADAGLSSAQFLGALGTGILKNTTTTGVLSVAVAADFPILNQNTTGSAATLTTPRAIYGNNFDGSATLSQIIASTYGGTGNGFTKFTGPSTSEKTFALPNANATILTDNALVTVAQGGTGQSSYTDGQLLIGDSTTGGVDNSTLSVGTGISVTNGHGSIVITNTGVTSAVAGTGIGVSGSTGAVTISNSGVTSLTGTANQVNVSASTGGVTLSTPQNIDSTASPTFAGLSLGTGNLNTVGNIEVDGSAARDLTVARSASTTGANLTIQSGGAVSGGTNTAGGNLILTSGTSTGNAASNIQFSLPTRQGSGSTTDNAPTVQAVLFTPSSTANLPMLSLGITTASASGLATTSNAFVLSGQAAGGFIAYRNTTANTAGLSLTVQSAGAHSGATDKAAGDLILATGVSTGQGGANVRIQTMTRATASGTSDNTAVDRLIAQSPKSVTNNSATTIASMTNANGGVVAGTLDYCVEVTNGTDYQVETGSISYMVTNKAGTIANNTVVKYGNQQAVTSGTLVVTFTITAANPALIQVNANSSLTPSAGYPRVTFVIKNLTQQAVAIS